MAIVYRTAGGWGAGKGSNLTPAEVDGNFYDHEGRIAAIEGSPPDGNGIASIVQSGSQMVITMDDATVYTLTMPTAWINWTGDWTDATSYAVNDLFSDPSTGNIYVVIKAHTSSAPFDAAATSGGDPVYDLMIDSESIGAAAGGGLGGFNSITYHSSSTLNITEDSANVFYIISTASNDVTIDIPADSSSFDPPVGTTIGFLKSVAANSIIMTNDFDYGIGYANGRRIRKERAIFYAKKYDADYWVLYGDVEPFVQPDYTVTSSGTTVDVTWTNYNNRRYVYHNAGSGVTFDLQDDTEEPKFLVGDEITFIQAGAGQMTFTCSSGTLNKKSGTTPISTEQWAEVRVRKTASNTWTIFGDYS